MPRSWPRAGAAITMPFTLLLVYLGTSRCDMGFLSWGALTADNTSAAGNTLYGGDGTFYGQQSNQNAWGTCSYGSSVCDTLKLDWARDVAANIALNDCQFQEGLACGLCLYFRGTGTGIGVTPLSQEWQFGFVDNRCPECAFGSLDIDQAGDGRWGVEWFPAPCHVGDGKFKYVMGGDTGNPYWFQFTVSNTRVPVLKVEMSSFGRWVELRRTYNNMYAANGGPFNAWPLAVRVTSVLNDTVYDTIPSKQGGQGTAQFPDRGPAMFPGPDTLVQSWGKKSAQLPGAKPLVPSLPPITPSQAGQGAQSSQQPPAAASSQPPSPPFPSALPGPSQPQELSPSPPPPQQPLPTGPLPPPPPPPQDWSPGAPGQPPPSPPPEALAVTATFVVPASGQCGGAGGFCGTMQGQCKDSVWDRCSCSRGFTCQRQNASWWECRAVSSRPRRGFTVLPTDILSILGPAASVREALARPQAKSLAAALEAQRDFTVPDDGQCGGRGYYCRALVPATCVDAQWEKAWCSEGRTCVRHNDSWWGCDPGSAAPAPATPTVLVEATVTAFEGPEDSDVGGKVTGSFQVVAGGQCGGSSGYCGTLAPGQCKDAVWDGAQCPWSYECQRWNSGWWQCMAAFSGFKTRKLR